MSWLKFVQATSDLKRIGPKIFLDTQMLGPKIFLDQHFFYQYFLDTIFLGPEICYDPELGPKKLGPINCQAQLQLLLQLS